jgi:hypothetical protein
MAIMKTPDYGTGVGGGWADDAGLLRNDTAN